MGVSGAEEARLVSALPLPVAEAGVLLLRFEVVREGVEDWRLKSVTMGERRQGYGEGDQNIASI